MDGRQVSNPCVQKKLERIFGMALVIISIKMIFANNINQTTCFERNINL